MRAFAESAKADLAEGVKVDLEEAAEAALEEIAVHVKSMKQHVLNAANNAKCLSSQAATGQSIARNASETKEAETGTGINSLPEQKSEIFVFFFSFIYNFPLTKLAKELACRNIK